jgi:hypothetical protein
VLEDPAAARGDRGSGNPEAADKDPPRAADAVGLFISDPTRLWNSGSPLGVLLKACPRREITVLCPSCKNRMSIGKIAQAMSEDARKINYHCAMCDIEIRQQRSNASAEANASIRDPGFAV